MKASKRSAHDLIAAAKRDLPPPDLEGAVLGSLGVTAGVTSASFAAKLWLALKHASVSKVSMVGVALGAAATGGYAVGRSHDHVADAPQSIVHAPVVMQSIAPKPAMKIVGEVLSPAVVASTSPAPHPSASTTDNPAPRDLGALGEELEAIRVVRADVLAGNAQDALRHLDTYDSKHPHGALEEESLALRVRANRLAGDQAGAASALGELEKRFPGSLQLAALHH